MPKVSKIRAKGNGYTNAPALKKTPTIYRCVRCGREHTRQKGLFTASHSPLFRENNGYLPYCSVCVDDMFDHYRGKLTSEADAMRRMCMICDIYWNPQLYESLKKCNDTGLSIFRMYVSKLNLNRYAGRTFDDTLDEERLAQANIIVPDKPVKPQPQPEQPKKKEEKQTVALPTVAPKPSADTLLFWGGGLTPEIYQDLNLRYQRWTSKLPQPLDDATEGLYKQLCIAEVNVNQYMAAGKSVEPAQKIINDIMVKLGISPDQQSDDAGGSDIENVPLGVWVKRWEDLRPLPDEDDDMKDSNNVIRYIHTWFLGHIGKMLGLKNVYTSMYEKEIEKFKVEQPELADVDDDDIMNAMFGEEDGDDE